MSTNQDDKLGSLLRQVDASIDAPCLRDDLAVRVRRQSGRFQARRNRLMSAAALVLAAVSVGLWSRESRTPVEAGSTPGRDFATVRQEIAKLRADVQLRMQLVKATERKSRIRRRIAELEAEVAAPLPDPLFAARLGAEQAARTLVTQGDRLMHEMQRPEIARSRYERVIQLYSQTAAAIDARRQLKEIDHSPTL